MGLTQSREKTNRKYNPNDHKKYEKLSMMYNKYRTRATELRETGEINRQNSKGDTILHQAVNKDNVFFVIELIKNEAELNIQNNFGLTPLHFAAIRNSPTIIKTLIHCGANKDIKTNDDFKQMTPEELAINYHKPKNAEIIKDTSKNEKNIIRFLKQVEQEGHDYISFFQKFF
jgi:ankyrin repeat protein